MLEMTPKQFRKEHPTRSYVADLFLRHKPNTETHIIDVFAKDNVAIYCYKVPVITTIAEPQRNCKTLKPRYIMVQIILWTLTVVLAICIKRLTLVKAGTNCISQQTHAIWKISYKLSKTFITNHQI